jgi:hypothetical protein
MADHDAKLETGKRIAARASGRAIKDDAIAARHKAIGIKDEVQEHEDERLNPGGHGGSGAAPGKPKSPSNSA